MTIYEQRKEETHISKEEHKLRGAGRGGGPVVGRRGDTWTGKRWGSTESGKRRSSGDTGTEMERWRSTESGRRRQYDGAGWKRGGGAAPSFHRDESPATPLGNPCPDPRGGEEPPRGNRRVRVNLPRPIGSQIAV
jgi:hypothetical protein